MIGPTCPACRSIHDTSAVQAVGRFNPDGVDGYRARSGGPLRATRDEAMTDVCTARAAADAGQERLL